MLRRDFTASMNAEDEVIISDGSMEILPVSITVSLAVSLAVSILVGARIANNLGSTTDVKLERTFVSRAKIMIKMERARIRTPAP